MITPAHPAALTAMTLDAAWQCHSDHEIGTLEAGKCADFVVLERDPGLVPPDKIGAIGVPGNLDGRPQGLWLTHDPGCRNGTFPEKYLKFPFIPQLFDIN